MYLSKQTVVRFGIRVLFTFCHPVVRVLMLELSSDIFINPRPVELSYYTLMLELASIG